MTSSVPTSAERNAGSSGMTRPARASNRSDPIFADDQSGETGNSIATGTMAKGSAPSPSSQSSHSSMLLFATIAVIVVRSAASG